jgi:DNA-binding transcriptional MerR regulator
MPTRPVPQRPAIAKLPAKASTKSAQPALADESERLFTIGELAAAHDITTRTIRFYEAKGLISPARRGVARSYSRRDRARLTLILRGKNLGFSLEEIVQFLTMYDADPSQVAQARLVLEKVDAHMAEMQDKRADIERTLRDLKDLRALCIEHLKAKVGP